MADFSKLLTEDRRLVIVRALNGSAGREANNFVLQTICTSMGHRVSGDVILADLAWLAEVGLLRQRTLHSDGGPITIASLTAHGVDVALGNSIISGVKRPLPGE